MRFSFAVFLCGSQACNADIFVIDDFSTAVERNDLTVNGLYGPGSFGRGVVIADAGSWATWNDTGSGIAGGRRDVRLGTFKGTSQEPAGYDVNTTQNIMVVNNPTSGEAAVKLTYGFSSENLINDSNQYLNLDFNYDGTANEVLYLNVVLTDSSNNSTAGRISFSNAVIGANQFDLATLVNWNTIGADITGITLTYDYTGAGADYEVGALSIGGFDSGATQLSAVPEPATALAIIPLFGFFAYRRRLAKKRESAAEDEQMEVESSIE